MGVTGWREYPACVHLRESARRSRSDNRGTEGNHRLRVEVTVSHTLDLPGDAQLVSGPDGFNGIKLGDVYISPLLTYLQTSDIGSAPHRLVELSAELKTACWRTSLERKLRWASVRSSSPGVATNLR